MTFVQDVLDGRRSIDDYENFKTAWEEFPPEDEEFHNAVGMLWAENIMWYREPEVLPYVVAARRQGQNLLQYVTERKDADLTAWRLWDLAQRRFQKEWLNPDVDLNMPTGEEPEPVHRTRPIGENFIQDVLDGQATSEDFEDYVTEWHNTAGSVPLHEWLGLLWPEYAIASTDEKALDYIIAARRRGQNLLEHLKETVDRTALEVWAETVKYAEQWRTPERSPSPKAYWG
ncbi:hypothetical protein SAMN05421505_12064 [Sinosporangium album]|uniref:Uncharacterized protein n=1 Tax=Sinosporangium album TaxID=504805 RepID=A0A1G8EEF7_9ACTN|nr:hypothetical protein [Sinosporangium album]SDH68268.1 hypothetical protein SAMN05421505_12064 [Sinosporangium album]